MRTLHKQIAVITGGGNGIGRACAVQLAAAGADIAILDLDPAGLETTAAAVREFGGQVLLQTCDCTDATAVRDAFQDIRERLGPVDILINNVGQSAREKACEFWESSEDTWRSVLEVSLFSTLRCSRLVVPEMRERRRGRIINISSDAALAGDTGLADYASAKMGVLGFTRSLARELAPFHVTVNAVCPGTIRTQAHSRIPATTLERIQAAVPMGYIAEPEDVAHLITFLAGLGARYITGQTLLVDGGRWMI